MSPRVEIENVCSRNKTKKCVQKLKNMRPVNVPHRNSWNNHTDHNLTRFLRGFLNHLRFYQCFIFFLNYMILILLLPLLLPLFNWHLTAELAPQNVSLDVSQPFIFPFSTYSNRSGRKCVFIYLFSVYFFSPIHPWPEESAARSIRPQISLWIVTIWTIWSIALLVLCCFMCEFIHYSTCVMGTRSRKQEKLLFPL